MKFIRSDLSARSVALNTRARSSGLCRAVPGDCHFQGCREGWEEARTQHRAQPQAHTEPQRCPATKINLPSPRVVAEDVKSGSGQALSDSRMLCPSLCWAGGLGRMQENFSLPSSEVGLDHLRDLLQPKQLCNSFCLVPSDI